MKKTVLRVVIILPVLSLSFLALTTLQATVSSRDVVVVNQTGVVRDLMPMDSSNLVLKRNTAAPTESETDVLAEIRFARQASLREALGAVQHRDLRIVGIQYSFYVGDQLFVADYSVLPDTERPNIRVELLKEHKSFLESAISSLEDPKENVVAKAREKFQSMGSRYRQALYDADSEKLMVEALIVEGSSSALKETKKTSPLIESVNRIADGESTASLFKTLIDSLRVIPSSGGGASDEWVPTGKITVGSESRRRRYLLVRMEWSDVSGFGFASTFEPDFFLNNSSDSRLGRGTYLDRREKRFRIPRVAFWASNLPRPYLDTRSGDSDDEVAYTIGSADANRIKTNQVYFNYIRTRNGDANRDNAKFAVQLGSRIPIFCFSTFCSFGGERVQIFPAWEIPVPGVAFF